MSDQFVAEIRIFSFNYAPTGWALCNGQLLPISQNTALFSLLGTFYGGDGRSTFALPNLQDSTPMQHGQGSGLSQRSLGEASGVDSLTLLTSEIPLHTHALGGNSLDPADLSVPSPQRTLALSTGVNAYQPNVSSPVAMAPQALAPAGGGLPHNNMQPYLTLSYCIALQGIFPQRQ
jgi:microcystin-dependent protein